MLRLRPGTNGRIDVEDHPAGNGLLSPRLAQHEPVVDVEDERSRQPDAGERAVSIVRAADGVEAHPGVALR